MIYAWSSRRLIVVLSCFARATYKRHLSKFFLRRLVFIALFFVFSSASSMLLAQPSIDIDQNALRGQLVDVASTGAGLAMGAHEANPLGLIAFLAKMMAHQHIKEAPHAERSRLYNIYGAFGWGAAVNNVCVIASIATQVASIACPAVGVVGGVFSFFESEEQQKEALASLSHCEEARRARPDLACPKQKAISSMSHLRLLVREGENHCHLVRRVRPSVLCDTKSMKI